MKKILIIDSHKGTNRPSTNLHWLNAAILAKELDARMIWSYPEVNENIESGYDTIIFNHASHYSYTDYAWLEKNPEAKLFYILNDHNLGEPRTLWMAAKKGRKYTVISNNEADATKIVQKYTDAWHILNLNALIYSRPKESFFLPIHSGCVYYGTFRKDRTTSFKKYLKGDVTISTHKKNHEKFNQIGVNGPFVNRLDWNKNELNLFKYSLYIEDDKTNQYYAYPANRYYEALKANVIPLFAIECVNTVNKALLDVFDEQWVENDKEIQELIKNEYTPKQATIDKWNEFAEIDRWGALDSIKKIINKD